MDNEASDESLTSDRDNLNFIYFFTFDSLNTPNQLEKNNRYTRFQFQDTMPCNKRDKLIFVKSSLKSDQIYVSNLTDLGLSLVRYLRFDGMKIELKCSEGFGSCIPEQGSKHFSFVVSDTLNSMLRLVMFSILLPSAS